MDTIDIEITLPPRKPAKPTPWPAVPRVPRVARLMALAIKFQAMVDAGQMQDYADIARLGYVTRARLTQIMNLILLAPDIQEDLLSMHVLVKAERPVAERQIRSITRMVLWERQRVAWARLRGRTVKREERLASREAKHA